MTKLTLPGPQALPLTRLQPQRPASNHSKIEKSAKDFETMAISQFLQPMFDALNLAKNAFGGGAGEEAWNPMLVQEFAKQITARGGIGLAKPIYDAMLRTQGEKPT